MRRRRAKQVEHPPFGTQVAFARTATRLGWMSLGSLAVGTTAVGRSGGRCSGDSGTCREAWEDRAS